MNVVFLPELTDQLFKAEKAENSAEALKNVLDVYSGRLGLNSTEIILFWTKPTDISYPVPKAIQTRKLRRISSPQWQEKPAAPQT